MMLAISNSSFPPLRFRRSLTPTRATTSTSNPNEYVYQYGGPKKSSSRRGRRWNLQKLTRVSSSDNRTVVTAPSTMTLANDESLSVSSVESASHVVRNFYGGINGHDLASVEELIDENCVYEDLIFPRPFVGRKAILEFFKKFNDSISTDLQFVIDDISDEDSSAVGVTWHLEWKGKPFPFSKGCSFYRLDVVNGKRQIIYGRDCVEPAIKPGETTLVIIRSVAWLLQQFPHLANWL
uniref:SnoaL-like domain-containing protein n=1 Tax=Davidia involucrata TaxID=16924 RepID=A0A5B7BAK5_DAVIN